LTTRLPISARSSGCACHDDYLGHTLIERTEECAIEGEECVKSITVDRSKRLAQEPSKGHNRWHEAITPVIEVKVGEEVEIETRDAFDGQITEATTAEDLRKADFNLIHALTGPVFVAGAAPGDLLEVEIRDMKAASFGYTVQVPGFGFLRDAFPEPYIAKWTIKDGFAESADLPSVRIPDCSFVGVIGVAPSKELRETIQRREASLLGRGGMVLPPEPRGAVPAGELIASQALRTNPPRENGGNLDIKQLSKGARLLLPVFVDGALFSVGDHISRRVMARRAARRLRWLALSWCALRSTRVKPSAAGSAFRASPATITIFRPNSPHPGAFSRRQGCRSARTAPTSQRT
jgi:acetamidase/formamidase